MKIPNRLRGEKILVDLSESKKEKKDPFKKVGNIIVPDEKPRETLVVTGKVIKVGHEIHPQDIKEGDIVYVKKSNGEVVDTEKELYLFPERAIIGND